MSEQKLPFATEKFEARSFVKICLGGEGARVRSQLESGRKCGCETVSEGQKTGGYVMGYHSFSSKKLFAG